MTYHHSELLFKLSTPTGQWELLYECCQRNMELLSKNANHLDEALAGFALQEHSLPILTILVVKMNSYNPAGPGDPLILRVQEFFDSCNGEQVRYATDLLAFLSHMYTQAMIEIGKPIKAIPFVLKAINKAQLHSAQLTSLHADLCLLALTSKCIKPALGLLDTEITEISKEGGHFDVKYFLLYYYYGGLIYTILKKFDRALYFFEAVLIPQSQAISYIMQAAYKKYVLVSLILHGKFEALPRYTSAIVGRYIRPACTHYRDVVSAYATNCPEELTNVINRHRPLFRADQNEGLLMQVLESLHKKNIQRLTKTFLTLSLSDVATRVHLTGANDAESRVVRMVSFQYIYFSFLLTQSLFFSLRSKMLTYSLQLTKKMVW